MQIKVKLCKLTRVLIFFILTGFLLSCEKKETQNEEYYIHKLLNKEWLSQNVGMPLEYTFNQDFTYKEVRTVAIVDSLDYSMSFTTDTLLSTWSIESNVIKFKEMQFNGSITLFYPSWEIIEVDEDILKVKCRFHDDAFFYLSFTTNK